MNRLLEPTGDTVLIPATGRFAVGAAFAPDLRPDAPVLLSSVLANFVRWYAGKIEDPGAPAAMDCWELQRNASNSSILAELGGAAEAETRLAVVYWLMRQQHAGQSGPLATNGFGNVFYVRDAAGLLRSVSVHWCDGGWSVEAMPIETITEWPVRDRVFHPAEPV